MENRFVVMKLDRKRVFGFIAALLLPLIMGILSALLTNFSAYSTLNAPPLSPQPIVFTLVWGALYVLMGTASYLIWRDTVKFTPRKLDISLIYYFVLLLMCFLWPILFFNMNMRLMAALWMVILIGIAVVVTVKFMKTNKTAAYLMLPLLIWLLFALYLNIGFVVLN